MFLLLGLSDDESLQTTAAEAGTYVVSSVGIIMCTAFAIYAWKLYKLLTKANKASPVAANTLLAGIFFAFCFTVEAVVSIITVAAPDLFDANSEIMIGIFYGFNLVGLCVLLYLFKNGVARLNPGYGKSSRDLSSTGSSRNLKTTGEHDTSSGKSKASKWGSIFGRNKSSNSIVGSSSTPRGRADTVDDDFGGGDKPGEKSSKMDQPGRNRNFTFSNTDVPTQIEMASAAPVGLVAAKWGDIASASARDKAVSMSEPGSPPLSPAATSSDQSSLFKKDAISSENVSLQIDAVTKKQIEAGVSVEELKDAGMDKKFTVE
jgi:hypothetical protein